MWVNILLVTSLKGFIVHWSNNYYAMLHWFGQTSYIDQLLGHFFFHLFFIHGIFGFCIFSLSLAYSGAIILCLYDWPDKTFISGKAKHTRVSVGQFTGHYQMTDIFQCMVAKRDPKQKFCHHALRKSLQTTT